MQQFAHAKIAFVVSGKSPQTMAGGLGAYGFNVSRVLSKLGYTVYLFGFDAKPGRHDLGFATLVHARNPYAWMLGLGSLFAPAIFSGEMKKILQEHAGIEEVLVFCVAIWGMAGIDFAKKMSPMRVKTVVAYFNTLDHEYQGQVEGVAPGDYGLLSLWAMRGLHRLVRMIYTPFERKIIEGTDKIVIHYEATRKILQAQFPDIPADRLIKIPYYIEPYDRQVAHPSPRSTVEAGRGARPSVVVICRQDPRKGINIFLHAVRILLSQGIDFDCWIAGDGIFLKKHRRLAERLGVAEKVKFLGFIASTEELLTRTDIYVLPSFEEGAGALSLLEAMKAGVAIVTTDCDGIPEDFSNGRNALLVPRGDPEKLAQAIAGLIRDPALRERLAKQAKEDYPIKFSFDKMSAGLSEVLA